MSVFKSKLDDDNFIEYAKKDKLNKMKVINHIKNIHLFIYHKINECTKLYILNGKKSDTQASKENINQECLNEKKKEIYDDAYIQEQFIFYEKEYDINKKPINISNNTKKKLFDLIYNVHINNFGPTLFEDVKNNIYNCIISNNYECTDLLNKLKKDKENFITTMDTTTSKYSYQQKYLKYKTKYLQLKSQQK